MTIMEAYTTIDNLKHAIENEKRHLMARLRLFIGIGNEAELETPVSVVIPEIGVVDVCKVKCDKDDMLWLYWKDPAMPSGYATAQSWMLECVEGNWWVAYLEDIVEQVRNNIFTKRRKLMTGLIVGMLTEKGTISFERGFRFKGKNSPHSRYGNVLSVHAEATDRGTDVWVDFETCHENIRNLTEDEFDKLFSETSKMR